MTKYVKQSVDENIHITEKVNTYIFQPAFYAIGVINHLTEYILKRHSKSSNLSSDDFKKYLNSYPVNTNDILLEVENIYQETLIDKDSYITDCYTLRQLFMFLSTMKETGYYTLDYENVMVIVRMINDFARRDVTRRAPIWYEMFSEVPKTYWPHDYNISSNTFTLSYYKNRINGGKYIANINNSLHEFYIIQTENKADSIKLTLSTNKVYISWQSADILEMFGDIITDNLFYDLGGPLYRILYENDDRISNDKVSIGYYSKKFNTLSNFVNILKKLSKNLYNNHYRIDSPWGMLYYNIDNIIDPENSPPYLECKIKTA